MWTWARSLLFCANWSQPNCVGVDPLWPARVTPGFHRIIILLRVVRQWNDTMTWVLSNDRLVCLPPTVSTASETPTWLLETSESFTSHRYVQDGWSRRRKGNKCLIIQENNGYWSTFVLVHLFILYFFSRCAWDYHLRSKKYIFGSFDSIQLFSILYGVGPLMRM